MRLFIRMEMIPTTELLKRSLSVDVVVERQGDPMTPATLTCGGRTWKYTPLAKGGAYMICSDGLPLPLHVICRDLDDARFVVESDTKRLGEGKAPMRGVFRLALGPLTKGRPGTVLAPSKTNPAVKRWQRIGSAHGTTFSAPLRSGTEQFRVGPSPHPGHVQLLRSAYNFESGPHVPAESVEHFHDDLNGVLRASPTSGNPHVDAVLSGNGERVGKGHDGIVYTTGDHAVKVSTTVPFHPDNSFHRTPVGAAAHLAAETAAHERFADLPAVPKATGIDHDGRHYLVKPRLTFGETYTAEELKPVFDTVRAMHARGFVVGDDVQVGRASDGKVYLSDLGQVRPIEHRSHLDNDERDDLKKLADLYRAHGHELPIDTGQAELAYRDSLRGIGLWRAAAKRNPTPENRARLANSVERGGVVDKLLALQGLHQAAGNEEALDALDREYDELLQDIHGDPENGATRS